MKLKRLRLHLNSIFKDHSFIRMIYLNKHAVSGEFYRCAQPSPKHIKRFAKQGIKTVINLRGERLNCGSYVLEKEACDKYGLNLVNYPISSRDMPSKQRIFDIKEILENVEYPAIVHCKSGADRTGLAGALYLIFQKNWSVKNALSQLSLKYGHVKQAKTGMLDFFFEKYLEYNEKTPVDFLDWVENIYEPEALKKDFMQQWLANLIINKIIRRE